ncbi:hypothetical protein BV898_09537 [Hypsibius exemplaris]|uniref:Uncharacterized protein n=1 Tax=Hypsibius exemplaris TaxID=2072580 RepID=A0A1W0WMG0_HYPEX|nr:hypothetical protein BV898_09537 [Hypsibius exemplaris]
MSLCGKCTANRRSSFSAILHSASRVQQDDPLGPLFCLVTLKLSKVMHSPLNAWYLYDGTLGSPAGTVMHDLATVETLCREIRSELSLSECKCFVFGRCVADQEQTTAAIQTARPEMTFPSRVELSLLGAPLLSDGVPLAIDTKTTTLSLMSSRLSIL